MSSITLAPEMYERVEQIAQERQTTVDSVFTEAVERYIWELQHEVIAKETRSYREQHEKLREKYFGQFIAMHNGEVVDSDLDLQQLRLRVRSRFRDVPILMTKVEQEADPGFVKRGFTLERNWNETSISS